MGSDAGKRTPVDGHRPIDGWDDAIARFKSLRPKQRKNPVFGPVVIDVEGRQHPSLGSIHDTLRRIWADGVWSHDPRLVQWLVQNELDERAADAATQRVIGWLHQWQRYGLPRGRLVSDEEMELVERQVVWRAGEGNRGGMPGRKTSASRRRLEFRDWILERYPFPNTRRSMLSKKGGRLDLVAEYMQRYPVSERTAYADLDRIWDDIFGRSTAG